MNRYRNLKSKIIEAESQYETGDLTREEYRKLLKGFYEEIFELEKTAADENANELLAALLSSGA